MYNRYLSYYYKINIILIVLLKLIENGSVTNNFDIFEQKILM